VVLTMARLDAAKGLGHLLGAAAQVPEALFVVAGEGPLRGVLEARARQLELDGRFRFLGQRWDVPGLLGAADLFVLPSLSEGLPLTVLEAMAAGTPVVATDVGGTSEALVHGETGLLVPPADAAALAGAIRTLLADRGRAERLAAAARVRIREHFSAETMVRGITGIYEDILSARDRG
jgi:glycosyltransferase involved in cell wall biosynthesis